MGEERERERDAHTHTQRQRETQRKTQRKRACAGINLCTHIHMYACMCLNIHTQIHTQHTHTHTHTHTYTHCKNLKCCDSVKTHPFPRQAGGFRGGNSRASSTWFVFSFTRPFLYDKPEKGGRGEKQKFNIKWNRGPPPPPHARQVIKTPKFTLAEDVLDANRRRQTYRERQAAWSSQPVPCACGGWCASPQTSACPCLFPAHTHTRTYMPAYTHTNTHTTHTHTHTIIKYRIWGLVQSSSVSTLSSHMSRVKLVQNSSVSTLSSHMSRVKLVQNSSVSTLSSHMSRVKLVQNGSVSTFSSHMTGVKLSPQFTDLKSKACTKQLHENVSGKHTSAAVPMGDKLGQLLGVRDIPL